MCAFYQLMRFMRLRFAHHRFSLILPLLWFCLFFGVSESYAETNDRLVESALQRAEELSLADHESWLALLHYKRETFLPRFISQVDDARFFLDTKGKTDARAELVADIRAFFRGPESKHAQCVFPARWWWLKKQLMLSAEHDVHCPQFEAFMPRISHDKLFLVFPTMYLNNPGSTFGHTFLRFDANDESVLLSKTLNYAARADKSDNIVSYVSKGVFGGYLGVFKTRPYYKTVQEYSNIENRDIWEYQLDFTAEEIEQLVRHIWEIKSVEFDYYFFRENCAYRLLALLDVIRPGMQLTSNGNFSAYAIPVDTVRSLDDAGLIHSRKFRASLVTQIDQYFERFNDEKTMLVLDIVTPSTAGEKEVIRAKLQGLSSDADRLDVLQQSYRILQYYGASASVKAQKILKLINEYSHFDSAVKDNPATLRKLSPEAGHDSIRIAAGYGRQNSAQYVDLKFRPSFHDLLDAPQGYIEGAAITLFDTRLKVFAENDSENSTSAANLRLESLSIFNISSLSPLRRWQKPVSWTLDFSFDRRQFSDTLSVRHFASRGGAGFSFKHKAIMPFVLLTGQWDLSSSYDKGYSLLIGLQAGLHVNYKNSQFMMRYEKDDAVSGFELDKSESQLQWQYNLHVNHAVRAMYKRTEYDFYNDEDWSLNYHYYF